jgi:EAL domain-containing protein (putative c-di-GMP-specific phosphodiesterase class I)
MIEAGQHAIVEGVISALKDDRMRFHLQPIVSAKTEKPAFYECLMRMIRPDGSTVMPGDFMAVAEETGLYRAIDLRALEYAVALLRKHPPLSLSVNISSLSTGDMQWVEALERLAGTDRSLTGRLVVEITETAAIADLALSAAFVKALRERGCRVAIDDYGAGHTSITTLKALPADLLKIDGAFVRSLWRDASGHAFIKSAVEIANALGMETVAEWVADEPTARLLRESGVTYLQGFHYGRPVPEEDVIAALG